LFPRANAEDVEENLPMDNKDAVINFMTEILDSTIGR
jgi:hypothetical protein